METQVHEFVPFEEPNSNTEYEEAAQYIELALGSFIVADPKASDLFISNDLVQLFPLNVFMDQRTQGQGSLNGMRERRLMLHVPAKIYGNFILPKVRYQNMWSSDNLFLISTTETNKRSAFRFNNAWYLMDRSVTWTENALCEGAFDVIKWLYWMN